MQPTDPDDPYLYDPPSAEELRYFGGFSYGGDDTMRVPPAVSDPSGA